MCDSSRPRSSLSLPEKLSPVAFRAEHQTHTLTLRLYAKNMLYMSQRMSNEKPDLHLKNLLSTQFVPWCRIDKILFVHLRYHKKDTSLFLISPKLHDAATNSSDSHKLFSDAFALAPPKNTPQKEKVMTLVTPIETTSRQFICFLRIYFLHQDLSSECLHMRHQQSSLHQEGCNSY